MIEKGVCHLFPTVWECELGLQLSKSNISGRLIVSGRAQGKENSCLNQMVVINKSMVSHNDPFLLGDRIMESPLKRCQTCKNCVACKKEMQPDEVRQIKQKEQVMGNLYFDPNKE